MRQTLENVLLKLFLCRSIQLSTYAFHKVCETQLPFHYNDFHYKWVLRKRKSAISFASNCTYTIDVLHMYIEIRLKKKWWRISLRSYNNFICIMRQFLCILTWPYLYMLSWLYLCMNLFFTSSKDHLFSYTVGAFVLLWALIWLYRDSLEIDKIKEKYVFITGCDSGFGNLLCKRLDKRGFRVLAGCLTEKGADDLKRVSGPYLKTCILDVTSTASIQNAVEWTKKEVGDRG